MYTPATIRTAFDFAGEVPRLFGRGVDRNRGVARRPAAVAIALWPVPTLVVVGDGLIADALRAVRACSVGNR